MKDFSGKIAFITGGASGAGLGQAKVFSKAGMKVAIADVRRDALHTAVSEIVEYSGCKVADVLPLCFDLTDRKAHTQAADTVEQVFGKPPHLLIMTAGVNSFGPVEASTFDDFDWVKGVCLDAVIDGLIIFVPRMLRAYGGRDGVPKEEFHIAATSSMGGFMGGGSPYSMAKGAVNSLIYGYNSALSSYGGKATVLCPGNINSNIGNAEKYRPAHLLNRGYHVSEGTMAHLSSVHAKGIDPVELAEILKEGIETGRVIVLPDRNPENWVERIRGFHIPVEDYPLTEEERKKKQEERAASGGAPPRPAREDWKIPEGAEGFGFARKDLDYIDPSRNPKWD